MSTNNLQWEKPLFYALILIVGMFLGSKMHKSMQIQKFTTGNNAFNEILNLVNDKYVEPVQTDSLSESAINIFLAKLDPHTVYISPSELQTVDDDLDGSFDGIGVEYFIEKDTVLVSSIIVGGPSEIAGLQTGDKFISVNDSIIAGKKITNEKVSKLFRGVSGSQVKVDILRGNKAIRNIQIKRGKIPMYSIDAAYMLNNKTGYIKINRFAATTYDEFLKNMQALQKKGMEQLVLDLRDNPGGFLEAAASIADEFLDGKRKIVETKGRNFDNKEYDTHAVGIFEKQKITVLVDEGSASASEILSGALQDYDRAVIIGRRTYGKGLVQEQYPLSNGGALRITVARYYIPSGRCIQKDYSHGKDLYEEDVMNRYKHGEMQIQDSIKTVDTTIYKTSKGRIVHGGGGIMPDIFIPMDTTKYSRLLPDILASEYVNETVNNYFIANKTKLQSFTNIEQFKSNFEVNSELLNTIKANCVANKINVQSFAIPKDVVYLKMRIKAQLAKSIFGLDGFYEIINIQDAMILSALKNLDK